MEVCVWYGMGCVCTVWNRMLVCSSQYGMEYSVGMQLYGRSNSMEWNALLV